MSGYYRSNSGWPLHPWKENDPDECIEGGWTYKIEETDTEIYISRKGSTASWEKVCSRQEMPDHLYERMRTKIADRQLHDKHFMNDL